MPICPSANLSWCQFVCIQIVLVPNCPGAILSWCQIVLVPYCLVLNCPGVKLSWCQIALVPNYLGSNCHGSKLSGDKWSWCQIVLVPNCLVIYCYGAKLSWCQIFQYQIVLLPKCMVHNCMVLSGILFNFFIWLFAWFRSWGVWYIVYPTCFGIYPTRNITLTCSVMFDSHLFNQSPHPISKLHFCYTFTFFFQSFLPPYPTQPNFWNILQFCSTFTFSIVHPTQSHFWKCVAFLNNLPFSNLSSHSQTLNFVFGTEELICQKNLRVVGRGLGWQTVGLIPPMFISWMTIPLRSHQVIC